MVTRPPFYERYEVISFLIKNQNPTTFAEEKKITNATNRGLFRTFDMKEFHETKKDMINFLNQQCEMI